MYKEKGRNGKLFEWLKTFAMVETVKSVEKV